MADAPTDPTQQVPRPIRSVFEWLKENSLSIAMLCLFVGCLCADIVTGLRSYNDQQTSQGFAQVGYWQYLGTGSFLDGLFMNWQAAILQLTTLIIFSEFMSQRGASHSRKPEEEEEGKSGSRQEPNQGQQQNDQQQHDPQGKKSKSKNARHKAKQNAEPWWKSTWLYRNSLSIAFIVMFLGAFAAHIVTGAASYNEKRALLHQPPVGALQYLTSASMWNNTFECWEAEFFVMWFFLIASIYLRQEYSAESKALGAASSDTGEANE